MAALYGANGAGKSNLVKALEGLKGLVVEGKIPAILRDSAFKLYSKQEDTPVSQLLAIEFITKGKAFYYGVELKKGVIATEELYLSGLSKKEDELVFERHTNEARKTSITLSAAIEDDPKGKLLKEILLEEFAKPDESVLKWLAARESDLFENMKLVMDWFDDRLYIISPNSKMGAFLLHLERKPLLRAYTNEMMESFKTGIAKVEIKTTSLEDFFGKDDLDFIEEIKEDLLADSNRVLHMDANHTCVVSDNGEVVVKELETIHFSSTDEQVAFEFEEESDGTRRLVDFVPLFFEMMNKNTTYIIDEIERSIHPLLIKELVRKFGDNTKTKGQLIFTTHESNLLDQSIFRQDEIWFAEKDQEGATDLYSLSDFKEHKTIDIQKGYLSGRYGSIPFLGDLKALNWEDYVVE
jgi:AAA15 family ATPase/GTPase